LRSSGDSTSQLDTLNKQLKDKEDTIIELKAQINQTTDEITNLNAQSSRELNTLNEQIEALNSKIQQDQIVIVNFVS
jgi:predicted  nucleic acid-binding Zn-ribbon protein